MAVVAGNLGLLLDLTSPPWNVVLDRKARSAAQDVALNLPKKELHAQAYAAAVVSKGFDSDGEVRKSLRVVARAKGDSAFNGVDFGAGSSDDEGDWFDEDDESFDWEKEMRSRAKDIEEMKELERLAEEVQNRVEEESAEESEEEKRRRIRKELQKVAKEQAQRRATAKLMFDLGQKAYGRGRYRKAIEYLEGSLTIIPRLTLFGGEIQIWLAMAYEANNRHADSIALYQQLEKQHPSISIRRQAADLRYIMQAPKLKITEEEMVTIPIIFNSYDSYAVAWSDKDKLEARKKRSTANQVASSKDERWEFLDWQAGLGKNKVFWVSLTLWLGLVGTALFLQR